MNKRYSIPGIGTIGALAALAAGSLMAAPAASGDVADSDKVSNLLSEAKTLAFQVKEDADFSADLAAMIARFVDYGKTKQKLEHLAVKLEIGARK